MKINSTFDIISQLIRLTDQTIIDIGCGPGRLVRWLTEQKAQALGVECVPQTVQKILTAPRVGHERYVMGVGQAFPLANDIADAVIFSYSLHHVPIEVMPQALREASRLLKPQGHLLILEPLAKGPVYEMTRPIDDEGYVRFRAYETLKSAVQTHLRMISEEVYQLDYHYRDADQFLKEMIIVDPSRRAKTEQYAPQIRQQFYQHSIQDDDGYRFESFVRVNLLQATKS